MKSLILASILAISSLAIASDDDSLGNWYDPGNFKQTKVEWLQTPEQECAWWHEYHSYDKGE